MSSFDIRKVRKDTIFRAEPAEGSEVVDMSLRKGWLVPERVKK